MLIWREGSDILGAALTILVFSDWVGEDVESIVEILEDGELAAWEMNGGACWRDCVRTGWGGSGGLGGLCWWTRKSKDTFKWNSLRLAYQFFVDEIA